MRKTGEPMERAAPIRLSVRDQVRKALRAAIVGGELAPGSVHSAPALAGRYGVSATPVREAMQLLEREGAVEVLPNRGFRICARTARDLADLAEVRALLEVPVMLSLARTVPASRWAGLRPLADATVVAAARGDRAAYAESDRRFHQALLELSGNAQLVAVADELHRRAQWPPAVGAETGAGSEPRAAARLRPGVLLADATEHGVLLEALVAGDVGTVESLAREHFSGSAWR
ncbi:GntR family transcriptional regulator [Streptomyces sp. V4-01]|uniref:GntR family transcriptional regulator n=1 Tax=Actinacidiphila polyblastidii TaxID=3110430 RepID=A0ABU7P9Z7_9ACTN|nr:GntR family transcriptional regulator [Streptomyces sp. V4-01]